MATKLKYLLNFLSLQATMALRIIVNFDEQKKLAVEQSKLEIIRILHITFKGTFWYPSYSTARG
jgi:hypothetical protein